MQGDYRIDVLMAKTYNAIQRHNIPDNAATDIYNRAYEAVTIAMTDAKRAAYLQALDDVITALSAHIDCIPAMVVVSQLKAKYQQEADNG